MVSIFSEFTTSPKSASNPAAPLSSGLETHFVKHGVSDGARVPQNRGSEQYRVFSAKAGGGGSAVAGGGNENVAAGKWMHGFKIGDMVWGKVESHPWWPGRIFNEIFAISSVLKTKIEGRVLVAFFGDGSYEWFDPAELIPFEPYFPEKSRQTNSPNFVNAVDEAVYEASRREALAVYCHCRNLCNLRPTSVPGYFAVDVAGYETGEIYSTEQIKLARDCFRPVMVLSFLHQLAVSSQKSEPVIVHWIKCKAMLLAYRKAVFEENDETYTEAFDRPPLRPSEDAVDVQDQPTKFTTQGNGKDPSAKKRHLIERRVDASTDCLSKPPPPDVHHADLPYHQPKVAKASAITRQDGTSQRLLIRRLEALKRTSNSRKSSTEPKPTDGVVPAASKLSKKHDRSGPDIDAKARAVVVAQSTCDDLERKLDSPAPVTDRMVGGGGGKSFSGVWATVRSSPMNIDRMVKKVKVPKRPHKEDLASGDMLQEKMKKKSKEEPRKEARPDYYPPLIDHKISKNGKPFKRLAVKAKLDGKDEILPTSNISCNSAATPLGQDRGSVVPVLGLPQLMSNLLALAVDPLHGTHRNAPSIVSQFFLGFRSKIYRKSLVPPPACEEPMICYPKHVGEQRELSSMPSEPIPKPDDSEIIGREWSNSGDQLEKWAARRIKEVESGSAVALSEPNHLDPVKNRELQGCDPATPTFLLMKFPPRTTLPSVASLIAKFGRFGPLVLSGTRVVWRSCTCKVLFKFESDALAAHSYAMNHHHHLFGQTKVFYLLQEAEAAELQPPEVGQRPFEAAPEDPRKLKYSRVVDGGNSLSQPMPSSIQPRSIQLNSGLKFSSPSVVFTGGANGRLSRLPSVDTTSKNPESVVGFHLPLQPPSYTPPPHPCRELQYIAPPPSHPFRLLPPPSPPPPLRPLVPGAHERYTVAEFNGPEIMYGGKMKERMVDLMQLRSCRELQYLAPPQTHPFRLPPPPPPLHVAEFNRPKIMYGGKVEESKVDVSRQLLNLLLRCRDIVAAVESSRVYTPYQRL